MELPLITCDMCVEADCCTELTIEMAPPVTFEEWEEVRWMVAHKNVMVAQQQDGSWVNVFNTPCEKLLPGGKCGVYETRPLICQEYPLEVCPKNGTGPSWVQSFSTMEEVDTHMEEVVIPVLKEHIEKEKDRVREEIKHEEGLLTAWPKKTALRERWHEKE